MPLVDIQLIRGVFTPEQKKAHDREGHRRDDLGRRRGDAAGDLGAWAIGGSPLTAADGKDMAAGGASPSGG
jgi:hypothetical protein